MEFSVNPQTSSRAIDFSIQYNYFTAELMFDGAAVTLWPTTYMYTWDAIIAAK
jgi:hypothetical protein